MKPTLRTTLLLTLSLTLIGCAGTRPAPQPSTVAEPTGFLLLRDVDTFWLGATRPYVKHLDETTQKWVMLAADAGEIQQLPAGSQQIGLVYSVAPPIISFPKMMSATPKPEHQLQVSIPKDSLLVAQYTIKSKAGGFAWDLTFGEDRVVMPSRNHPDAFNQLHALVDRTLNPDNDPNTLFPLAIEELAQLGDARSILKLDAARATHPLRRVFLKRAIKRIRKANR